MERLRLEDGPAVVADYQPGNGTRYIVTVAPWPGGGWLVVWPAAAWVGGWTGGREVRRIAGRHPSRADLVAIVDLLAELQAGGVL